MREITYVEALREAIRMAMEKDPSVFVIGEDIGVYGGAFGVTAGLIDQFGKDLQHPCDLLYNYSLYK